MTTPPREHDISDVGPVNNTAATSTSASAKPPEIDETSDLGLSSAVEADKRTTQRRLLAGEGQ